MNIKTLFTQTLIVVISIILVIDIFLLSNNLTMQILKVGILMTFLYFSSEMVRSIKKEKQARKELEAAYEKINHYVEQLEKINMNLGERNEDLGALLEVSAKVSEGIDPKKIAQNVVNIIPRSLGHLGNKGGLLMLYDKDARTVFAYAMTESALANKAVRILDKPYSQFADNIDKTNNFISKTIKTKKMYVGEKLSSFIYPTVSRNTCSIVQKVLNAKSFISVPLFSRARVMGVILFVGSKAKKDISQRDKDMLYMFSSNIGSAIENAQLYEQSSKQITELANLNKSLEEANRNLKELLEMKNEFLHITSHQLRTPLTAIRGMISMWYEGDFENLLENEKKEMIKRIYVSTERLNNITNDMLDALELEGGILMLRFKPVSIEQIVKETIETLKPNYDQKSLYLKLVPADAKLPEVEAEPNYIRQVFMNIIDNASKYTKEGGVTVEVKLAGKYIETIVNDTGIGVSKLDQKKMFQKFSRGKNAIVENASGSGLGLFIARKIVSKHHGKVELYSEGVGKGTTIKIYLPIKQKGSAYQSDAQETI